MNRISKYLLVTALMVSIGAQWAVLQSAAWVGMAVTYSLHERSVAQGLSKTFDGAHPCALCDAVTKGKQSEKKDPKENSAKIKLELFCHIRVLFEPRNTDAGFPLTADEKGASRAAPPTTPPPRSAAQSV